MMQLFSTFIKEDKPIRVVKKPIDLGDDISIKKLGYDLDGNWCYWLSCDGGRFKKVKHSQLTPRYKLSSLKDLEKRPDIVRAFKEFFNK